MELTRSHPSLPEFLECRQVGDRMEVQRLLAELDFGEAEAIVLAKELHADELLMDESSGRRVAMREGVPVIGLLGVLLEAKGRGLIGSVGILIERLEREAGFYVASRVKDIILREAGE